MAPIWGLDIPVPSYLSLLLLLGFLIWGLRGRFSGKLSWERVAAKTDSETLRQNKLKKIQKYTVPQWEENFQTECNEANQACISGIPVKWSQEYIFWSMDRSLQNIFQHLENARSNLGEMCLSEPWDLIPSSTSSVIVAHESILPYCNCKKAKHTDQHISSGPSYGNSSLSHLSVSSEGKTRQLQSHSLSVLSQKQLSKCRNQGTSLPSFQLSEHGKSKYTQDLAALSYLRPQNSFIDSIFRFRNVYKPGKKKFKRRSRHILNIDHGTSSVFKKKSQSSEWAPIQLSPLARWELEGHMARKVCTLRKQTLPLLVKESWAMMNYVIEVRGGDPEPQKPHIQLSMPIHESTKGNINNKSPDHSSFQLYKNCGMESGVYKTERKHSQLSIPGKQLQPGDGPQTLGSRTFVTAVGITPPQRSGVDKIQEETTLLQKDPKHVLELSIEQRVTGIPEKGLQHKTQRTNVELTPRQPYHVTDSIKVTPSALLQVMDSMGMIPESHSEVKESVGFFPQPPNKVEKSAEVMKSMSMDPKPSFQITESVTVTPKFSHQIMEPTRTTSRPLNQVTDNVKVTAVALLQVMDSMGIAEKAHPNNTESVEMMPQLQYQVMESVKTNTPVGHQLIQPENMNTKPQHADMETLEMTPGPQQKVVDSVGMTSGSQSEVTEMKITPGSIYQNTDPVEMISRSSHQVTPVALLQVMDFMGIIPPEERHGIESGSLTRDSQSQFANLTPRMPQLDGLPSNATSVGSLGVVESMNLFLKPPPTVMEPRGMFPKPLHQSIHSLKATLVAVRSPVGKIRASQSHNVETKSWTPKPTSQDRRSLDSSPESWIRVQDPRRMIPQPHHPGTESTTLTPGLPHQVIEPVRLVPQHQILEYSEISLRQRYQGIETMGLSSDSCLKRKKSAEQTKSYHTIMEPSGKIPTSLSQGTESMGLSQKPPPAVMTTTTSLLQDVKPLLQMSQLLDSTKSSPGLQNVKCEELLLGPGLEHTKFVDITTDSTPQTVKYGQVIPDVNCIELAPELQLQSAEPAELSPQLQRGKSAQSSPGPQLPDITSTQLTVKPPQQSIKSEPPQQQIRKSIHLTSSSQSQGVENVHLELPPEFSVIETVELNPIPQREDVKPKDLAPKSWLQDKRSDEMVPVLLLKAIKTQIAECRRLLPETQAQGMKYEELTPGGHIQTVKPTKLKPKPSHQATEPEGLTPWHQASESLRMSSEPGTPVTMHPSVKPMVETPLSQYTTQESLRSEMQGLKSKMLTPESLKFAYLNLGPYSEDKNYQSLTVEPHSERTKPEELTVGPLIYDKFVNLTAPWAESRGLISETKSQQVEPTVEPHLQTKKTVGLTSRQSHQETASTELASKIWPQKEESVTLTPQRVLETTGMIPKPQFQKISELIPGSSYQVTKASEALAQKPRGQVKECTGMTLKPHLQVAESLKVSPRSEYENTEVAGLATLPIESLQETLLVPQQEKGLLGPEKSELLWQHSKPMELTSESSPLVVGSRQFITRPKSHITQLTPEPQLQGLKSRQLDSEPQLQNAKSVKLIQQSTTGVEKAKKLIEKSALPSKMSEELTMGSQLQDMKLTQGPQLKSIKFSKLPSRLPSQGEKLEDLISGSPHHGMKSDELIPSFPMQETKLSDVISGQKPQSVTSVQLTSETQTQHQSVELNSGPCLQEVQFSDLTPESKHQGFKHAQYMPEAQFQDIKPGRFITKSSLQLSQGLRARDIKSVLSVEGSPFQGIESVKLTSEAGFQSVRSEELNLRQRQEDVSLSELISGPQFQGVKLKEQTPMFHGVDSLAVTPELGLQDSKLLKMSPGCQGMSEVGLNTGPSLQDVKFCNLTSETQHQHVKSSESGPQLQRMKFSELTPGPQKQGVEPETLVPQLLFQGIKHVVVDQTANMERGKLACEPQISDVKSIKLIPEPHLPSVGCSELTRGPQAQDMKSELIQGPQLQDVKPVEMTPISKLQDLKSKFFMSKSQIEDIKSVTFALKQYLKDITSILLTPVPQTEGNKAGKITSGTQKDAIPIKIPADSKLQGVKSFEVSLPSRRQELKTTELTPGTQLQGMKAMELKCGPKMRGKNIVPSSPQLQVQGLQQKVMKPEELTSGPQMSDMKFIETIPYCKHLGSESIEETPDSELQYVKSVRLTPRLKKQIIKSVNMIRKQRLQGVKPVDLTPTLQFQGITPVDLTHRSQDVEVSVIPPQQQHVNSEQLKKCSKTEDGMCLEFTAEAKFKDGDLVALNPDLQLKGMKSFELTSESDIQSVKHKEFNPEPQLHEVKHLALLSESHLQSSITLESKQEPQPESRKYVQWIPISEFQVVKSVGLNLWSQFPNAKSAESKSLIQLKDVKSSELTLEPKIQGATYMEFNGEPQVQNVNTPEFPPGPDLQKGEVLVSTSQPPLHGVKTVESNPELQLESKESVQWIPAPEFPGVKTLGSQSQCVQPTELKPLMQLRDMKSSVLTPRPKFQGKQSSASVQEHQSQGFDLKTCLQFGSMESCDPTSRSKLHDIKSIIFKSRLQLQNEKSPESTPGPQLEEGKPFQPCPGTQPQVVKSPVLIQEPQLSTVKSGLISQGSQLQNDKAMQFNFPLQSKCMKSAELTLQTRIQGMKFEELNSGSQWQGLKSSKLPLETKSQDMNSYKLNLGSRLQGIPFSKLPFGTKIQGVKSTDFKMGSFLQGIKCPKATLKTKLQDEIHKECNSHSQKQVMKSSEVILGPKLQNVNSVFNLDSQLQGIKSKLIPDTRFQDMESVKVKPGPQLQSMKSSALTQGTKLQKATSGEFKSNLQLQDTKSSRIIMGIKLPDVKSTIFKSRPHLNDDLKSSEGISRGNLQGVKSVELKPSPKILDEKSSDLTMGRKVPGVKSTELHPGPQLEDITCSELIMGIKLQDARSKEFSSRPHFQDWKSSEVIPGTKFQEVKTTFNSGPQIQSKKPQLIQELKLQDVNFLDFNHGAELQSRKSSDLTQRRKPQGVRSEKFNPASQRQGEKSDLIVECRHKDLKSVESKPTPQLQCMTPELTPKTRLQSRESVGFNTTPTKQDKKSFQSTLDKELQNISLKFNSAPQLPDRKPSKLTPGAQLQEVKSMEFNLEGQLQTANSSKLVKLQIKNSTEVNHGPNFQTAKSLELPLKSKIENVISSELSAAKQRQDEKSCKLNSQPEPQNVKLTVFNSGPHLHHIKSSETCKESKLQHVKSIKFNLEQQLQDVKSELSTKMKLPNEQFLKFKHEPKLQGGKSSGMNPGQQLQCINSKTGSQSQDVNSSALIPEPKLQCINSTEWNPGSHCQGLKSELNPESKFLGVALNESNPRPQMQCANSPELTPQAKLQCGNLMRCEYRPSLQGVKSFELTSGTKFQDNESEVNTGIEAQSETSYQGLKSELNSESKFLGTAPRECKQMQLTSGTKFQDNESEMNTGIEAQSETSYEGLKSELNSESKFLGTAPRECKQMQCVNSSKMNPGPKLQCGNSMGCIYGSPLQGVNSFELTSETKCNDMKSSDWNPESELQDIKCALLNLVQHLQDIQCDLASGTKFPGISSKEFNSGLQLQCVNCFELNSGSDHQCIDSIKLNSGSQMQGMKPSELNPGPEYQGISFLLNPGPHLQDTKYSELTPGTNFPVQILENHTGSKQQVAQPVFTSGSQLSAVKSGAFLSEPLVEDKKSMKMKNEPSFHGASSVKLISDSELQGMKCGVSALQPCVTKGKSVGLSSGPHPQVMNPEELSFLRQHIVSSLLPAQEPSVEDVKSLELKAQLQPQDVIPTKLNSCHRQKSMVFESEQSSQNVKSMKPSLWLQPHSSLDLSAGFTSQCINAEGSVLGLNFQDAKYVELKPESQRQGINCQELISGWQGVKSVVMAQEPTNKFIPGPMLTSVKFSNMSPELHQAGMKSLELIPEPKLQSTKQVKLSSVSLKQTPKPAELIPGSLLQRVKSEELTPRINYQSTDYHSEIICRPGHQFVEYAKMIPKPEHQALKAVNLNSPIYETTESTEMAQSLAYQSMKTVEKAGKAMKSSGLSLELDLQVPKLGGLTPVQRTQNLNFLELASEKSYQVPETLELLSQSEPQIRHLGDLDIRPLQQVAKFVKMKPETTHYITRPMEMNSETRLQKEEFLGMTPEPKSISKTISYIKRSPKSHSQALEPKEIKSGKRLQRGESLALIQRTLHHVPEFSEMTLQLGDQVPDSVELTSETRLQMEEPMILTPKSSYHMESSEIISGFGCQVPKRVDLTSKQWLQKEESLELSTRQTGQLAGHIQSVKLISESQQQGKGSIPLTQFQKQNIIYSEITPGPLDQNVEFKRISPKSLDPVTQPAKTQHQDAHSIQATTEAPQKVAEFVKVTPGPSFQVVKSVTLKPQVASQMVEYVKSTSKPQDIRTSEFTSESCVQNVKSNRSVREPTHHILETTKLTGFQIVKSVLIPGPLLQIVESEELAPGPIPQVIEPIVTLFSPSKPVTLGLGLGVIDCLDLLPRPHKEKVGTVEKVELTPKSNTEVKSSGFTSQSTFPFMEFTVLTHKDELQAVKSLGRKTGPPQVMESEDSNLGQSYQKRDSRELELEETQIGNYFSRYPHSSSNSPISSSVKTSSEFGGLWYSEMPEVSRTLGTKKPETDILQPEESFTDPFMVQSLTFSLPLHNKPSDKTERTPSEIPGMDIISKERTKGKQVEEVKNSLQSYSQHPPRSWRYPSSTFHTRLGTRKSLTLSALGRQQNVWENHFCRQRLPRKYLSNMLILGNVLGTTMEKEFCSQMSLTEKATADTWQSIQNLFGVPAELMEFSQIPLEKGSQPSVVKNYIQRHASNCSYEKRMTLRMWTRGSMSSIIRQHSGTRMKIKKTDTKFGDISQEVIQHMPISNTEGQYPASVNSEASFNIFFKSGNPIPVEESENSQSGLERRIFDCEHSLKPHYPLQAKNDFSEQFQLLQDLQLKIAAKLLRNLIPPNIPPPLATGMVLKYPICLQCGRCSGRKCCHKLQGTFGSYLLIYPQLHLVCTPEGRGEIRFRLGFRLRTGKRIQVPKYHRKDRPISPKSSKSPLKRKTKKRTRASKSPTSTKDFCSGSSHSPPPVKVHIRQKQSDSPDLGKTEIGKPMHREFTEIYALSESNSESNQDEKWAKVRSKKTPNSKYPKRLTNGIRTPSKKFSTNNRNTIEHSSRELPAQLKRRKSGASQTTSASLKRQPKKSSQPKFIQLLFQGLKQAFQRAHRILAFAWQNPEDRTKADYLWRSKNYPEQEVRDYFLSSDIKRDRKSVVSLRSTGSTPKQESILWEGTDQSGSAQQFKRDSSFQPRLIQRPKSQRNQVTSVKQYSSVVQNDIGKARKKVYRNEIFCQETKNYKTGTRVQAQGRILHGSLKKTSHSHLKKKLTPKEQNHHSFFYKERTPCNSSERIQYNVSERSYPSLSQRSHPSTLQRSQSSRSQKSHSSHSQRSHSSHSHKSHLSPSQRRHQSSSERRQSVPERRCRSPSERRCRSPSERRCRSPSERRCRSSFERSKYSFSEKTHCSPSEKILNSRSEKIHYRPSERSHQNIFERRGHSHSERTGHNHFHRRRHCHSERSRHSHSERIGHSHSEKTHLTVFERTHPSPRKERLKHNSPRERPRHSLSEDLKSYPNMSSKDHTKTPKAGQVWRPEGRFAPFTH